MTKIVSKSNCGNSPKMEFIKEFNIAFAEGNVKFLRENIADEIVWNIIGERKTVGRKEFEKAIDKMKNKKMAELQLEQILTHGKEGAANGLMKMQNGKKYAFADFYIFKSTKNTEIVSLTSHVIEVQ